MSNNQRSTGFLAIRYTLAAIMVGVFFGLTAIGTEAQRVSTATRGDRSAVKEQPATVNAPAVAFTPGNLAVVQMGDGVAVLSGNAAPVSVLEYTPAGVLVQTIAIPSGAISPRLTVTGSSGSEGHIVRSSNGGFLTLTGYDVAAGTAAGTFAVAGTPRTIARLNAAGTVDLTTAFNDGSTGAVRSAASTNGIDIWQANSVVGLRYGTFGTTAASTQVTASPTSTRVVKIFNGQLYMTSGTATFTCVNAVGTGTPTTAGQTTTPFPGMTCSSRSPYSFSISPAGTTLYLADDGAVASDGGIQKWTFAAGTWTKAYTLLNNGTVTTGVRGLTVNWSGANPIIYGTTSVASANTLISVVDTGAASTANTLATSPVNTVYRGVDFVPGAITAAGVSVSGRVARADGRGIVNARITVTGGTLTQPRVVYTRRAGQYIIEDLQAGETYVITVGSRRFTFADPSRLLNLTDNATGVDFVAN